MDGCLCKTCASETCWNAGHDTYTVKCSAYCSPKPITKADEIRAMRDEELADFLYATWKQQDAFSKDVCEKCPDTNCQPKCWLDWLKQEAEEAE